MTAAAATVFDSREVHVKFQKTLILGLCLGMPSAVFADFQYTETTKVTGGSIVNMMKFAGKFSKQARQANEQVVL
jgi:hypothetical protein